MDNWTIQPLGIENEDIADSKGGSDNEEISDVVLADLPEEGIMDEPAAKPSLLLRDPHMNITVEEQEDLPIPPPPLVANVCTTCEEEPAHPPRDTEWFYKYQVHGEAVQPFFGPTHVNNYSYLQHGCLSVCHCLDGRHSTTGQESCHCRRCNYSPCIG